MKKRGDDLNDLNDLNSGFAEIEEISSNVEGLTNVSDVLVSCEAELPTLNCFNYSFGSPDVLIELNKDEHNLTDVFEIDNSSNRVVDNVENFVSNVNNSDVFARSDILVQSPDVFYNHDENVLVSDFRAAHVSNILDIFDGSDSVINQSDFSENVNSVVNNSEFSETDELVVNNSVLVSESQELQALPAPIVNNTVGGSGVNSPPVTVNLNAYNEVRVGDSHSGSGADVDMLMSAFCERLSDAVTTAVEGVKF
ncbi:MAG: hypothetical protein FWF76_01570 [Oscillospiraceae bacterium]|nr:hypothetical protein [Oscillospiraceae bacterium]